VLVDQILGLFYNGVKPVQLVVTNMLYHLEQEKEVKQRLLTEIDAALGPISDNL